MEPFNHFRNVCHICLGDHLHLICLWSSGWIYWFVVQKKGHGTGGFNLSEPKNCVMIPYKSILCSNKTIYCNNKSCCQGIIVACSEISTFMEHPEPITGMVTNLSTLTKFSSLDFQLFLPYSILYIGQSVCQLQRCRPKIVS